VGVGSVHEGHAQKVLRELTQFLSSMELRYHKGVREPRNVVHGTGVGQPPDRLLHLKQFSLQDGDLCYDGELVTKLLMVKQGRIASNDSRFFQLADAAENGPNRYTCPTCERPVRSPAITKKFAQNLSVNVIDVQTFRRRQILHPYFARSSLNTSPLGTFVY